MAAADEGDKKPERFSLLVESNEAPLTPEQRRDIESENGLRQYDLMDQMIGEAVAEVAKTGRFRLRPYHLHDLNREAVDKIVSTAGSFRSGQILIENSKHRPPDPRRVARLVEEMCDTVNAQWDSASAIWLSSYVMWRVNWIHPFEDGNGRTSRTASYLVLCAKLGHRLPGREMIPEFIAADKHPYYDALEACDNCFDQGIDLTDSLIAMEQLLEQLLARQLLSVATAASGKG